VLKLRRRAIDIGIVTRNLDAMLAFYKDLLGMRLESTMDMPGGSVMSRLRVGDSLIKIIVTDPEPPRDAAPGGIKGATGCRYWTIHIANLDEVLERIEAAGHNIRLGRRTIREGVDVGIVEDPDGNWLELVETTKSRWMPWVTNA
jgi:catechol 2,3-dioxygenase-like lactoylglutathione lyase family enzyme